MIYCETCQQDFNEAVYLEHLDGFQHQENLAEQGEAVMIDFDSSVFLTPPPSPPDYQVDHGIYYLPHLEDEYVPEFSEPNSPTGLVEKEPHELPLQPPRPPRLEDHDHDPSVLSCPPWRYFNRASLLEGINDANEDNDDDDEDEPPFKFFE